MNPRLLAYLHSRGLDQNATEQAAWDFFNNLRGIEASIASALNHAEADTAARTNSDLMIRALGYNPEKPSELLPTNVVTATVARNQPGSDGASLNGDLERRLRDEGAEAERLRVVEIRQLAAIAGTPDELMRQLTDDRQIPVATARERIFADHQARTRAQVPLDGPTGQLTGGQSPAGHSRNSQTDFNQQSLACAMMLRQGINDPTRRWISHSDTTGAVRVTDRAADAELCRAVDRGHELQSLPLVVVVQRALALGGIQCEPTPSSIAYAMRSATAVSTSALLGIFSQTFGALMIDGYVATADTTAGWTVDGFNPNFFRNERTRMKAGRPLQKHAKGGEAEHLDMSDLTEYTKLFRYSGQFVIDDMDLINDTIGALATATPREMGEAARQLRPDLVYAMLFSNPTMSDGNALFHSSRGNLIASSAFTKDTLQAALTFLATRRENGRNLNLRGSAVITPAALMWDVRETIKSGTLVIAGTTDRTRGDYNALSDEVLLAISDGRLDNGVTDPNSGTTYAGDTNDWYVATARAIEVTYLRGSGQQPEMRSGVLDRGQFGIWFDVKQDIGASPLRALEIVKMTA